MLVAGLALATVDGAALGAFAALGWTLAAVVALVAGLAGAFVVALLTPPPRAAARPSTVTLGLPLRDAQAVEEEPQPVEAEPAEVEPLRQPARTAPAAA
ncbi:hypothetical protein GCM10007368_02860 [Isoptericola cucumis]|uniref:Uncharacterized protein n=1 Tax=Isoptericola cucumis TaxID=1776856 RepID=A0ABQ2B278_9MICO|nr:hypothetical protein GCM10007368_02860 [Isoptericola cucumis]